MSGSGISWAIYKSATRSRQINMPTPHHSVFYRPGALLATQTTASKHWRLDNSAHNAAASAIYTSSPHHHCCKLSTDCNKLHDPVDLLQLSLTSSIMHYSTCQLNTHTHLMALCPGLPGWAGTRKKMWILLKQETVSGSGITWATCKSAPRSSQITTPPPHHSVFTGRLTESKHWRQGTFQINSIYKQIQEAWNLANSTRMCTWQRIF